MVTNNISEIRKEKHLSQDDLAVALGVCRKSIFNIEHNNVIPNIDTCLRLAKYLDMTVEELYEIQDALSKTITQTFPARFQAKDAGFLLRPNLTP